MRGAYFEMIQTINRHTKTLAIIGYCKDIRKQKNQGWNKCIYWFSLKRHYYVRQRGRTDIRIKSSHNDEFVPDTIAGYDVKNNERKNIRGQSYSRRIRKPVAFRRIRIQTTGLTAYAKHATRFPVSGTEDHVRTRFRRDDVGAGKNKKQKKNRENQTVYENNKITTSVTTDETGQIGVRSRRVYVPWFNVALEPRTKNAGRTV